MKGSVRGGKHWKRGFHFQKGRGRLFGGERRFPAKSPRKHTKKKMEKGGIAPPRLKNLILSGREQGICQVKKKEGLAPRGVFLKGGRTAIS